jgi:hypothetical protein
MRKILRKIIQILDGTPAEYGKHQKGQSVLEMAFITPLLIILIAGTIEVGWFTNNYLILMEATRVGARNGTVLEGNNTPIGWERDSYLYGATPYVATVGSPSQAIRNCANVQNEVNEGFYNIIACVMIRSVEPLTFTPTNGEDDIIISAFSLQTFFPPTPPLPSGVPTNRTVVVARYPSNANECITWPERDPFDYFSTGVFNPYDPNIPSGDVTANSRRAELDGYDNTTSGNSGGPAPRPYPADPERQVGFMLYGNHEIPSTTCTGSEFTIAQIETVFNLNNFGLTTSTRQFMPSHGVTLAEVYWQHKLLLQFPAFSPLFRALGNQTVIHVWAAFPTPSIEPRIRFEVPTP